MRQSREKTGAAAWGFRVLQGFIRIFKGFIGFCRVLEGVIGFYKGFIGFCRVS